MGRKWCRAAAALLLVIVMMTALVPVYAAEEGTQPPVVDISEDYIADRVSGKLSEQMAENQRRTEERMDGFMQPDHLSDTFLSTFVKIIVQGTSQTIAGVLDPIMKVTLEFMLKIEECVSATSLGTSLSPQSVAAAYRVVYGFACSLAVLKFLSRGFQVYLLWRDGDPETSPLNMLTGMLSGFLMMIAFPLLYNIMVDATLWFAGEIMRMMSISSQLTITQSLLQNLVVLATGTGIFQALLALIWAIMAVVLFVKMLGRGVELLILRLGFPIACLGLIDSDGGLFKGYVQIFFKTMATSVIQICLICLSFAVVTDVGIFNLVLGIAIVGTAFATPALMQSLLIPGRTGGGFGQKIHSTGMAVGMLRGVIGK